MTEKELIRVLIVDDEKSVRETFVDLLKLDPRFEAVDAANLTEARETLIQANTSEKPFHIIVVDVGLGEENGLELIDSSGLPTIIMSGSHTPDLSNIQNPYIDFLKKPATQDELIEKILNLYEKSQQQRQAVPSNLKPDGEAVQGTSFTKTPEKS